MPLRVVSSEEHILNSKATGGLFGMTLGVCLRARARTVEPLPLAQHLLDVTRHDLLHLRQLLRHLVQVPLRPRVQVQPLRLLDERVCTKHQPPQAS